MEPIKPAAMRAEPTTRNFDFNSWMCCFRQSYNCCHCFMCTDSKNREKLNLEIRDVCCMRAPSCVHGAEDRVWERGRRAFREGVFFVHG